MFLGNKSLALDFVLLSFIIARFQSSLPHVMVFTYQTLGRCTYIWSKDNKPEGNIRVNIECIVSSRVLLNPIILELSASSSAKVPLFGECPSLLGFLGLFYLFVHYYETIYSIGRSTLELGFDLCICYLSKNLNATLASTILLSIMELWWKWPSIVWPVVSKPWQVVINLKIVLIRLFHLDKRALKRDWRLLISIFLRWHWTSYLFIFSFLFLTGQLHHFLTSIVANELSFSSWLGRPLSWDDWMSLMHSTLKKPSFSSGHACPPLAECPSNTLA